MQGGQRDPNAPKWRRHWNKIWRKKTWEATEYQYLVQEAMAYGDWLQGLPKLAIPRATHLEGIALTLVFFIPRSEIVVKDASKFKGRDVSNYVKMLEDAVFEYLSRTDGLTYPQEKAKIEDASDLEPHAYKRLSWDDDWHIVIILSRGAFATYPVHHLGVEWPLMSLKQS